MSDVGLWKDNVARSGEEMPANEASFKTLVGVPVHYDRLSAPFGYGSKGKSRTFQCRNKLKSTLEKCFAELFEIWAGMRLRSS